jgi:TonB family protein
MTLAIAYVLAGPHSYQSAIAQDGTNSSKPTSQEQKTPNSPTEKVRAENSKKPIQTDVGKLVVLYQPDADPYYPAFSRRAGEQGAVVVRLLINESGEVYETALVQSSTFQRLDRAAIEIGKRYKFKPLLVNGTPVKISTNLLIKFNLTGDKSTVSLPPKDADIKNGGQSFLPSTPKPAAENNAQSTRQSAEVSRNGTPTSRLSALKEMLDKGLITEKDYNTKKQEILNAL